MSAWDWMGQWNWSAIASVVSTIVAALAAWWARSSAKQANNAAQALARIEAERHHAELRPLFSFDAYPQAEGSEILTMKMTLIGPPELAGLDGLTVSVRNDDYRRGDIGILPDGVSGEQVARHIWGPYKFIPGTGPYDSHADEAGRSVAYDTYLPVGEHLEFVMEPTTPPLWSVWSTRQWMRQMGSIIKTEVVAHRSDFVPWRSAQSIETRGPLGPDL